MPDWSKLGKSSRRRGCAFERMVARKLTQLTGITWLRTPMSGGHGIKGDVYVKPVTKDLIEADPAGWDGITVYCRTQRNISWEKFFDGKGDLIKWMKETGEDSLWVFRTKPGCLFFMCHSKYIGPGFMGDPMLRNGAVVVLPLSYLGKGLNFNP